MQSVGDPDNLGAGVKAYWWLGGKKELALQHQLLLLREEGREEVGGSDGRKGKLREWE